MSAYAGTLYRDYFTDKLPNDVGIKSDIPITRPRKLLVVTTVPASGPSEKPWYFAMQRCVAQWWVGDDDAAGKFGQTLRKLVTDSRKLIPTVHRIWIVGEPGRFDDPDDTAIRFQMTWDVETKV